jgi:hypothetical protein
MISRRLVLTFLSGLLVVGAFVLSTVDIHADQRDCGSSILPRDTSQLGINTGNVENDDFATQVVLDDCSHNLLAYRMLCGGMLVLAVGSLIVARRQRPHLDLPGGPIL